MAYDVLHIFWRLKVFSWPYLPWPSLLGAALLSLGTPKKNRLYFQKHDHLFLNCLEIYEILCDQSSSQRPTCLETWDQFQPMATSSLLARWGNNCSSMKYLDFFIKKDKMMIFSNRLLQFLCLQVTSAFSRSFVFEPFRKKKLWKKQAFQRHLFMDCCYFFKLSVIRLSRMGGRLQWNIFSWDEVGRHSGEQLCWEPLLWLREWVRNDME